MLNRLRHVFAGAGRFRQALLVLVLAGTVLNVWMAFDALSHVSGSFLYTSWDSAKGDVFNPPANPPNPIDAVSAHAAAQAATQNLEATADASDAAERPCDAAWHERTGTQLGGTADAALLACLAADPRYAAAERAHAAADRAFEAATDADNAAFAAQAKYDQWRTERAHYDAAIRQVREQTAKAEFAILAGGLSLWLLLPRATAPRSES